MYLYPLAANAAGLQSGAKMHAKRYFPLLGHKLVLSSDVRSICTHWDVIIILSSAVVWARQVADDYQDSIQQCWPSLN